MEQARVKAAQVEIASQVADIALRQSMLESTVTEAWLIYKARAAYAEKPGDESLAAFDKLACDAGDRGANLTPLMKDANGRLLDRDCRFDAQWAKLPPNRKFKLLEATGLYLDSIGRQHSVTKRMEVMRQALAAQKASGLSEVNAGMWMSLIDTVVTQAADFGSLGLRGSDFTKLYELLGLTGIAIGTNK